MPVMFWRRGKKYRLIVADPETGEEIGCTDAYFYGAETDKTDFWYRMSMLAPEEREAKRKYTAENT